MVLLTFHAYGMQVPLQLLVTKLIFMLVSGGGHTSLIIIAQLSIVLTIMGERIYTESL